MKSFFIFLLGFVLGVLTFQSVFAQEIESFSASVACNSGTFTGNLDTITGDFSGTMGDTCFSTASFITDMPSDVLFFDVDSITYNEEYVVFEATSTYTIVGMVMVLPNNGSYENYIFCGDNIFLSDTFLKMSATLPLDIFSYSTTVDYHCTEDLQVFITGDVGFSMRVYYVPYDTRILNTETGSKNIIFGLGIIIFMLATIFGTYMKSIFKKKND